jgi:hypothetical protein
VGLLKSFLDGQVIVYTVLALIPNLLLILWAMARLSREVRLLKSKMAMVENDINLLDQSISNLTVEFQAIRQIENRKAGLPERAGTPPPAEAP